MKKVKIYAVNKAHCKLNPGRFFKNKVKIKTVNLLDSHLAKKSKKFEKHLYVSIFTILLPQPIIISHLMKTAKKNIQISTSTSRH